MNNALITIGVLIVVVLSALFAIPYFVDWNSYRGVIEEEASRIVGRDVRIGGDIKLQLLPAPSFVIRKLRVADAATGSGEPLFRAERVDAKLSIVPLVRGILEANEIELVRPVLRLALDDSGRGNWRSLAQGRGSLPFVPTDVALRSVKITDGALSVADRNGSRERLALARVTGQLSAPALEGPYRFRGGFGEGAQTRDLRFTTLPPDADGAVQIKAILKDIVSNASVTLDGRLRALDGQPQLTGELAALVPLPAATDTAADSAQPTTAAAPPIADVKANIVGTASEIALNNLSVTFEGSGRPEVLAGEATFSWNGDRKTVAKLSAPWIDLDNVLGNPTGGNPVLSLGDFARRINGLATGIGTATAVIEIDQASLGHELIGGVRLEARSSAGMIAVERLRASLPGGTKVEMQGRITGEGTATTFDGDMTMRGNSLARLAAWSTAGNTVISPANDLPFQLRSRVTAEPARGGLRDIVAQVGDSTLEGEIDYAWTGSRKLRVAIEGARIDARAVAPAKLSLRSLGDWLGQSSLVANDKPAPSDKADGKVVGKAETPLQIAVTLKSAELVLPNQTLTNVSLSIENTQRALLIERLQFSAEHGLAVSLDGRVGSSNELRGSVAAADIEGVKNLSDFFDFPLLELIPAAALPDLLPLRLAGTLNPGAEAGTQAVSIAVDGRVGQADTKVKVALAAGLDGWRTAAADLDIVLLALPEAQLAAKLLAALKREKTTEGVGSTTAAMPAEKATGGSARLAIRATGIAADGLSTAVRFDSPEFNAYVDGRSHVTTTGTLQISGDLTLDARDGRGGLNALGGMRLALSEPLPMQGTARLSARDGGVGLSKIALVVGRGTTVAGGIALDAPAQRVNGGNAAPRHLSGALNFSSLDIATLLAPALQQRPAEAQAAIQVTSGRTGAWPDLNFDFSGTNALEATLLLTTPRLAISDDVGLTDVSVNAITRPGAIEFRQLTGTALGGRLTGSAIIDGTSAVANLTTKLDLTGAQLATFGGDGTADLALTLTGNGVNPAGLISGVAGNGTVKLGTASLRELTPDALQAAIDTALKAPPDKVNIALRTAVGLDAGRAPVRVGPRTIGLVALDGVLRTQQLTLGSPAGRMVTQAALDLATFGMTGDWRVETRMPPLPPMPQLPGQAVIAPAPTSATVLPAVVLRFALSPADLDPARKSKRQPPETDALERELAVRKVERDLFELERIRRLDEERAAVREREEKAADELEKLRRTETRASGVPEPVPAPSRQ